MHYWANLPPSLFAAGASEWARAREQEGWAGICASDHLFLGETAAFPHLWVKLTEMACATTTIRLTSSFSNNLFRSPVEFAHAALTLQQVSNGRFEAGLGAGWAEDEMARTGRPFPPGRVRLAMLAEALAITGDLFRTGGCRFKGEHFDVDIPEPTLKTVLDPSLTSPPLLASAGGRIAVRRVAGLIDRLEITSSAPATRGGQLDFEVYKTISEQLLRDALIVARDVRPDLPIGTYVMVAVAPPDVTDAMRAAVGDGFMGRFVGSPSAVAQALADLEGLGLDRVQLTEMVPGSIEALGSNLPLSGAVAA